MKTYRIIKKTGENRIVICGRISEEHIEMVWRGIESYEIAEGQFCYRIPGYKRFYNEDGSEVFVEEEQPQGGHMGPMHIWRELNSGYRCLQRFDCLIGFGKPRKPISKRQLNWWKELRGNVIDRIEKLEEQQTEGD